MEKEIIKSLAAKVADGAATTEEISLYNKLCRQVEAGAENWDENLLGNKSKTGQEIKLAIEKNIQEPGRLLSIRWKKIAVAASILLMLGAGYWLLTGKKPKQTVVAATPQDLNPGSFKARLTLADGTTIVLDSAAVGELTKQGGTVVMNKNGQLVYSPEPGVRSQEIMYNTLSTAKGESYATILADGSKVWLNSASSIKYPVAFNGNERRVEITGEAYFSVVHNAKQPFKVIANGTEIEDLGTEFNVNAYPDEADTKATLVNGALKIGTIFLKPGEQAIATANGIDVDHSADIEKITAWKNNDFFFSGDDIQTIMRQIARWYDVDVTFSGQITDRHFTGIISRNNKLSEVLKMLQATEKIKFEINGRKITVSK